MRQIGVAVAVACAAAQFDATVIAQVPAAMPGQVVGSTYPLNPVGDQIPRATTPAGTPIGSPFLKPNLGDPLNPFKGTGIDPKNIVAPAMGYPGTPLQEPDLFDRLSQKLNSVTAFFKPSPPPRPTYTPGISRRNRERAMERMWRRD
ncbi:MAG TPA: hypothetical protein VKE74_14300 [Gemmataceae bacterium]|nr:hypothetical protein [Gemmataceae bacterium]